MKNNNKVITILKYVGIGLFIVIGAMQKLSTIEESKVETPEHNVTQVDLYNKKERKEEVNTSKPVKKESVEDKINHNRKVLLDSADKVEKELNKKNKTFITMNVEKVDYDNLIGGDEYSKLNEMSKYSSKTIKYEDKLTFVKSARELAYSMNKLLLDNDMEVK